MNQRLVLGATSLVLVLTLGIIAVRVRLSTADRDYHLALRVQGRDQARYLERTLDLDQGHVQARLILSRDLMALGQYRRAIGQQDQLLHLAASHHLDRWELFQQRGEAYNHLHSYPEAEEALRQAIVLRPDAGSSHLFLGRSLEEDNQPEGAIQEFRKATDATPPLEAAYLDLGALLLKTGDTAAAAALGTRMQSGGPALAMDWRRILATDDLRRGREAEALAETARAARCNPRSSWPHLTASSILDRLGRTREAVGQAALAVALAPAEPDVRLALAAALEADQQWDRAVHTYQEVEGVQPQAFSQWVADGKGPRSDNAALLTWQEHAESLINPGDVRLMGPEGEPGIQQVWYIGDSGAHRVNVNLANSLFVQGTLSEVRHDYASAGQFFENGLHFLPVAESDDNTLHTNRLREAIEIGIDSVEQSQISGPPSNR